MNRRQAIVLFAATPFAAIAQSNNVLSLDDLIGMGQQFVEENVDEDVLAQLGELDEEKIRAFLKEIQEGLEQDYVLDLASLKESVNSALKLLDSNTVTEEYAQWLRPRVDYFDVASELKQASPPPPKPVPGKPVPPKPAPTPVQVQTAWTTAIKKHPRPVAAVKYEALLKPIFTKNNVPKELFWMAEIESSFNPKARSPSGAVGLYQLMPATAKSLGLSTWLPDERKNPEKCADAAARHLKALFRQFKDWPLAVAAYNAGGGRVKSKLDGAKTKTFEAISAKLPSETQMYVPKLNAVLQLREGVTLGKLAKAT